jgi:hypothetical protein
VWSNDPKVSDFPHLNADDVRRYKLDLKAGRLSTNGTKEDHDAATQALKAMREWEDEFAGIGDNAPTAAELAAAKERRRRQHRRRLVLCEPQP